MSIPNVSGALRGWTKRRKVRVITKQVVNHLNTYRAEIITLDMNLQPLQPEKVRRLREEQRAWKWYSMITKAGDRLLKIDDQIQVNGVLYSVGSVQPWDEGGYRRYECYESFAGLPPLFSVLYQGNEADAGKAPDEYAYQAGAVPTVAGNTFTREGFAFVEWNTEPDGYGDSYEPGDTLTVGTSDITLYAIWEATI